MHRTMVVDAMRTDQPTGQPVLVQGWVRSRRDSKAGLSFIALNDGSCFDSIQIVAPGTLDNFASVVQKLSAGCSISCTGALVESQGKGQSVEIQAESIELIGDVEDPETYPISPKHHSFEYLRTVQHLRARTNTFGAVARVRNRLSQAIHQFFDQRRFLWVHTPFITAADAEGAGELFRVSTLDLLNTPRTPDGDVDFDQDFFGKEAFLTVSGQLNVETYCCALSNVYTFGPTFRAENSHTARHLAEFWMIEPEIAFGDLTADVDLAIEMMKYVLKAALDECADDMKFFNQRIEKGLIESLVHVIESDFVRMTYTDAVNEIGKAGRSFEYPVKWGDNLQTEHERYLCEEVHKKPVVVTDYPKDIKAFYMRLNDDEKTVAAMDLLVPRIGELIGGSQREERLDQLDARLDELTMDRANFAWYRDLRRYGTVPHAGFGLGFDRLVMYVTGMANMRDVIPFPRAPRSAEY